MSIEQGCFWEPADKDDSVMDNEQAEIIIEHLAAIRVLLVTLIQEHRAALKSMQDERDQGDDWKKESDDE
jgi:hypothetical protein